MKMLIADDNEQICSILSAYANNEGYETVVVNNGNDALQAAENNPFDIILLDVMMPGKDGFEVCRRIRTFSNVPIIMITARSEDFERIMGLDNGADDYIVKPFSPGEVMARIRAVLRRIRQEDSSSDGIVVQGNLTINLDAYKTEIDGIEIPLTKKETELLWTLAKNPDRVFSRENLLNSLWGYDYYGDVRTVDSHIKRLRAKLKRNGDTAADIKTIWGVGYKFEMKP